MRKLGIEHKTWAVVVINIIVCFHQRERERERERELGQTQDIGSSISY